MIYEVKLRMFRGDAVDPLLDVENDLQRMMMTRDEASWPLNGSNGSVHLELMMKLCPIVLFDGHFSDSHHHWCHDVLFFGRRKRAEKVVKERKRVQ